MDTLTEADIRYVRLRTQDNCTPPDVDDEEMQILYDNLPSSCGCASSIDTLIAVVWDVRLSKAAPIFDEDGEGGTRNSSQVFDHMKKMRDQWFAKCGMDVPVISVGTFDMGLDEECDGSENASYPYRGYLNWMGL